MARIDGSKFGTQEYLLANLTTEFLNTLDFGAGADGVAEIDHQREALRSSKSGRHSVRPALGGSARHQGLARFRNQVRHGPGTSVNKSFDGSAYPG